uniref:MULE transposase domain-containing protein n=1 Tax=Ditylenchus dipsaci TaxID=166011 RepID=A0A915CYB4_9BILA
MLQVDGTYKTNWLGFLFCGFSDSNGKFFATFMALVSTETTWSYKCFLSAISSLGYAPELVMGDGDSKISAAVEETWEHVFRAMCFAHVMPNLDKKLRPKELKNVRKEIEGTYVFCSRRYRNQSFPSYSQISIMIAAETYFDVVGFMDLAGCRKLIMLSDTMSSVFIHQMKRVKEKRWLWLQYTLKKMQCTEFIYLREVLDQVRRYGHVNESAKGEIQWNFLFEEFSSCLAVIEELEEKLNTEIYRTKNLIDARKIDAKYGPNIQIMPVDTKFDMLNEIIASLHSNALEYDRKLAEKWGYNLNTVMACAETILRSIQRSVNTEIKHFSSFRGIATRKSSNSGPLRIDGPSNSDVVQNYDSRSQHISSTQGPASYVINSTAMTFAFEKNSCTHIIEMNNQKLEHEIYQGKVIIWSVSAIDARWLDLTYDSQINGWHSTQS